MFTDEFLELIETISVNLIELDEKGYSDLASILSLFDKVKDETNLLDNEKLSKLMTDIYAQIEKLILRDIEPIKDINDVYDKIYQYFDKYKKMVSDIQRGKISPTGELQAKPITMEEEIPPTAEEIQHDKEIIDEFGMDDADAVSSAVVVPEPDEVVQEEEIVETPQTGETPITTETVTETPVEEPVAEHTEEPAEEDDDDDIGDVLTGTDSSDVDDDMFLDFVNEAKEYVSTLENLMLDLEQTPNDLGLINEIFRPFHTLKGVSGFMGMSRINKISHEAENILDKARNGKLDITPDHSVIIFKTIDIIKKIIFQLDVNNKKENVSLDEFKSTIKLLKASNKPGWKMSASQRITTIPDSEKDAGDTGTTENVEVNVSQSVETEQPLQSLHQAIAEDIKTTDTPVRKDAPAALEGDDHKKGPVEDSIRVKIDKLDFLIDMVGELVITYNLFHQDKYILNIFEHEFLKKKSQLQRVISDLQKASMSLRMVPIGQTFTKMKRVIRDYTVQHKKTIDLVLIGEDTEIDRNMVDSLNEPLVHMIRNSCDHGIESAEERKAKGKNPKGIITLQAYHKGNNIVIDVKDDGKGLDKEKILAKAISKGLVNEGQTLTDSQIYNLVFLPGFSTMEVVSNVSGRGVGMDVVMQAIKMLGGAVDIISEPGKGSTFRIALPLTLAIIEGLLVVVSGELYILPIANVRRTLKPDSVQLSSIMNKGETVKVENSLIPIIRLHRKFHFLPQHDNLSECLLIMVEAGEKRFALAVDEQIGIQSVVVKTLGEKFKDLNGISGATIMGDGKVALILDCNKLDIEG